MANEASNDFSKAVGNLMENVGKIGQMQIDLLTNGVKTAGSIFESMNKTSMDILGNVANAVNNTLQNVASGIAPKK
jgi:chlorosome envelope protein B